MKPALCHVCGNVHAGPNDRACIAGLVRQRDAARAVLRRSSVTAEERRIKYRVVYNRNYRWHVVRVHGMAHGVNFYVADADVGFRSKVAATRRADALRSRDADLRGKRGG